MHRQQRVSPPGIEPCSSGPPRSTRRSHPLRGPPDANCNAVRVAAKALDASDDATCARLWKRPRPLLAVERDNGIIRANKRVLSSIEFRTDDGLECSRTSASPWTYRATHQRPRDGAHRRRARGQLSSEATHFVRTAAAARKGDHDDDHADDDVSSFDFQALGLCTGTTKRARSSCAKTYVETCAASPRQPRQPSILEVARAIAGAGFFQEAVWTASLWDVARAHRERQA